MEYNFEADLHTHTIASGHAYNTIREMARAAADKGLKALGITEHALPSSPGSHSAISWWYSFPHIHSSFQVLLWHLQQ